MGRNKKCSDGPKSSGEKCGDGPSSGDVYGAADWPAPMALEGIKSKKKPIFEADSVKVFTDQGKVITRDLSLSLEGRVAVLGDACGVVATLLQEVKGGLKVLHVGPAELSHVAVESSYLEAVTQAIQEQRPHILVVKEALASGDEAWREAFAELVLGDQLCRYRGAVVVCLHEELNVVSRFCRERWIVEEGRLLAQPCLHVTQDACRHKLVEDTSKMKRDNLALWLQPSQELEDKCGGMWTDKNQRWTVTRFDVGGMQQGPESLRGLIIHHMIERDADFHVRYFWVPQDQRGSGMGGQLVRWVIEKAAHMPPSECRCVSLDSKSDKLTSWYEQFGFVDMSTGHKEVDDGLTPMELRNVSVGGS